MKKKIIYTEIKVIEILPDDGLIPHHASPGIFSITAEPEDAYEILLNRGIDCSLVELELGFDPNEKIGFHLQAISNLELGERTIYRQVDLFSLPIVTRLQKVRTIWKINHFYDANFTQSAAAEFPPTVRTLQANNLSRLPLPDGSGTIGEYDYFAQPVIAGYTTNIKQNLTQTVIMRDAEGRFN
ncbi:MAG: hypothetical protein ACO1OF_16400 [Adhaeribacter sp.]